MQALLVLTAPLLCIVSYALKLPPFSWLLILPLIFVLDKLLSNANLPAPSASQSIARLTLLAGAFTHFAVLFWGMQQLNRAPFDWNSFSLLLSMAVLAVSASSAPVGHELIHKRTRLEKWAGGLLFSSICFPTFNIEHLRGHHVHAGTPQDADSADKGQSYYQFVWRTIPLQFKKGVELEQKRLMQAGLPFFSWQNELFRYAGFTLLMLATITTLYGMKGLFIYLVYSLLAICSIEMIQYMSHYGLKRQALDNGKYAKTLRTHSWNSNGKLSELLSVSIQKHSAHHEMPSDYFYVLDINEETPLLPLSYYLMFAVALFPPLWFKMMDHRVDAVMQAYQSQINTA